MAAYLDSSVLVKRYVREPGSENVDRLFTEAAPLLVSAIALAECLAALGRQRSDGSLSERAYGRARRACVEEWASLNVIAVSGAVQERVADLLDRFTLRGMDALHLASALWTQAAIGGDLSFVCSDRRLAEAARRVGLRVIDPEL